MNDGILDVGEDGGMWNDERVDVGGRELNLRRMLMIIKADV
jgi:hypothetical protein